MSDTELTSVQVRPATATDDTALRELADRHFGALLPGLPAEFVELHRTSGEQAYAKAHPDARALVIEVDGAVAGRLLVAGQAPAYRLVDVVVDPARRGAGVGTCALRAWLAEVDRAGADVTLDVAPDSAALHWAERLGFVAGAGDTGPRSAATVQVTMRREPARA